MANSIHIALAFDDNFWAPAYATMRSICISTKCRKELVFHLLHFPLSAEHRADLDSIASEYGAKLNFYELESEKEFLGLVHTLPTSERWPAIVYARLALTKVLPANIDRIIYLDTDLLVRWPIELLYAKDLFGAPLGAVKEALFPFIPLRKDMRQNADIFDGAEPYFNSGVLLIDLNAWRDVDFGKEIAALASNGTLSRLYYDQDLLNLIFKGRWTPLEWRWNVIDAHAAHEALDPAILHFTYATKPWALRAGIMRSTAYARWYRHVMTNELFYRFARHRWKQWWLKRLGMGR